MFRLRLPQARLDQVLDRFHQVEARMGAATDGQEIVRLSKEHAEMKPVADAVMALGKARAEIEDLRAMAEDPEMAAMAADGMDCAAAGTAGANDSSALDLFESHGFEVVSGSAMYGKDLTDRSKERPREQRSKNRERPRKLRGRRASGQQR